MPTLEMLAQPWSLSLDCSGATDDFAAIYQELDAATEPVVGSTRPKPFAVLLRDRSGRTVGGLWGRVVYAWLVIEMLVVPEQSRRRGIGTSIMTYAEDRARELGCRGIQVSSFDFQAPEFYRRLGFSTFGILDDFPPGHAFVHFSKRIA